MLIEKEIIAPGQYWYIDEKTSLPRVLDANSEMTKYWHDQGNKMIAAGLTIPLPYEHDFKAHPMTPKENLLNNSGWMKEYKLRDEPDPITKEPRKDVLFGVLDIQDENIAKKLPKTIRWTSPWINSFTDGSGKQWNNVISHLALTTRPRITKQSPFPNIAAALSLATPTEYSVTEQLYNNSKSTVLFLKEVGDGGIYLSRAGLLTKNNDQYEPRYPMAFSVMMTSVALGSDGKPFPKKKTEGKSKEQPSDGKKPNPLDKNSNGIPDDVEGGDSDNNDPNADKLKGPGDVEDEDGKAGGMGGDLKMEEILCHLLQALGVPMPDDSNPNEFHRHLYEAAMSKIKELTSEGMGKEKFKPDQNKPPNQQPNSSQPKNPIIGQVQQEQQPMYMGLDMSTTMSLEELNKITDPVMKQIALSMYTENQNLLTKLAANEKTTNSLRDAKLKEANASRQQRINMLSKLSPKVKDDLATMIAAPSMALSMGDAGEVLDPMEMTLKVLENGLAGIPKLLTIDSASLNMQPQPTDGNEMTDERSDALADTFARQMGCSPLPRKVG